MTPESVPIIDRSLHPEGMTIVQEELALKIVEVGALVFEETKFVLHENYPKAPLSPIYTDFRVVFSNWEAKAMAVELYLNQTRNLQFDLIAPIPVAAVAVGSSMQDRLKIKMLIPRLDAKTHGRVNFRVDGYAPEDRGKTALIIDDLVSRADTKVATAKILEDKGLSVSDVLVLADYDFGGEEELNKLGYKLHSSMKIRQILDYNHRINAISGEVWEKTVEGLENLRGYLQKAQ